MPHLFFEKNQKKIALFLIFVFFSTSWLQGSHAIGEWTFLYFSFFKKIIVFLALLSMATLVVVRFEKASLSIYPFLFLTCIYLTGAVLNDGLGEYFHRIIQIVFFFLFVSWIQIGKLQCSGTIVLHSNYAPAVVSVICLVMAVLFFQGVLVDDIATGFGNSRGSFSIWLMQLIAFYFLFKRSVDQNGSLDECLSFFLYVAPVFLLQSLTGSRTGMLGSLMLAGYFMFKRAGYKGCVFGVVLLLSIAVFISQGTKGIIKPEMAMDPLRVNEVLIYDDAGLSDFDATFAVADRYSSYRLSLINTAFSTVNLKDLILGVGIGNFQGWIPRYPHLNKFEVHNVFLRMLGEMGVFSLIVFVLIVLKGFWRSFLSGLSSKDWDFFAVQLIYILIAMLHPDLLLTAVGTSIVYMYVYALSTGEGK